MAINYPTSLDSFTNPSASSLLTSPSHAQQHADINDAMEAVQTKLAIGNTVVGTYTAYTPSISSGVTIGNGVVTGAYCRVNNFVHLYGKFTLGSTSAVTGSVVFNLPVNVNGTMAIDSMLYGTVQFKDVSANGNYPGVASFSGNSSSTAFRVQLANGTFLSQTAATTTFPFTWATGDFMTWNLYYRAA